MTVKAEYEINRPKIADPSMFKHIITGIIISVLFTSPIWSKDEEITIPRKGVSFRKGISAAHGASSATAISMIRWGLGLTAVIAIVAAIIKTSPGEDSPTIHTH